MVIGGMGLALGGDVERGVVMFIVGTVIAGGNQTIARLRQAWREKY